MTLTLTPETEARLRAASEETGLAPEAVIGAALEALLDAEPKPTLAEVDAEQARLNSVMQELIAEALALVPEPLDSPTRKACRESPIDGILVDKFRRQGFTL